MCGSMADIQSPAAEIRRGNKKRKKEETAWKYIWSAQLHRATIKKYNKNKSSARRKSHHTAFINAAAPSFECPPSLVPNSESPDEPQCTRPPLIPNVLPSHGSQRALLQVFLPSWDLFSQVTSAYTLLGELPLAKFHQKVRRPVRIVPLVEHACKISHPYLFPPLRNP